MEWEPHDPTLYSLLAAAHRRAEAIAADAVFELGLMPVDARVLGAIPTEERAHATALARWVGVRVSTITRALRRLERLGYVELQRGPSYDARRLHAVLTAVGHKVAGAVRDFERGVDRELVRGMSGLVKGGFHSGLVHIVYAERSEATAAAASASRTEPERSG
ncbi:MAG: MarR family winged helix-turn-helix transcriptional regulator [Longimicrobiales bacterium]